MVQKKQLSAQDPSSRLRGASRRELRLVVTRCLDEVALRAFLFEAQIEHGRLAGSSHFERVLHLLQLLHHEGSEAGLVDWLERERPTCVQHQLALLANPGAARQSPEPLTSPDHDNPPADAVPLGTPTRGSVRRLLIQILPTHTDLDAFLIDSFPPELHRRFPDAADRESKHNLLLNLVEPEEIVAHLGTRLPAAFSRWQHLLEYKESNRSSDE